MSITDKGGRYVEVNNAWLKTSGFQREELIGRTRIELGLIPIEKQGEILRELLTHDSLTEVDYKKKDGEKVVFLVRGILIDLGGHRHLLVAGIDITGRKRMEEELQRSHRELEQRVEERTAQLQESEKRLKELAEELINVHETERKRIAHEIHDGLAAQLAAIKYRVEHRLKSGVGSPIVLEETFKDIDNAMNEIRRIMGNLRPPVLDDLGLIPALSWYLREIRSSYPGTLLEYAGHVDEKDIPENLRIVLFRVIQESVANAVLYGKSSLIKIGLAKEQNWLRLSVEDNGDGFEALTKSEKGGIGLDSMQQRVDSTGGIFSISSTPGKGTVVKAEWKIG